MGGGRLRKSELLPMQQTPNIVYIHSHDTGRYIQPYGYAIPTPNLQRLAEEGVLFRRAFCAAPTCSPSRAALLTGQSAHSSGMLGLVHRGFGLYDTEQHLLHTLRRAGYFTALAGIQHVFRPEQLAEARYDFVREDAGQAEVAARDFLTNAPRQPFFLDVGFNETHRVGTGFHREKEAAQNPVDDRYCRPPAPLPDTPETRRDMADFIAAAARLDRKIGVVLEALAAAGLAENTLVIYTTDHGIAFPGMKCQLTDHGIGVSLILRGPGGFDGGKVIDALVSQIEVFPTLCDLLSIERPPWLQGNSMMPLVRGETDHINDAVFAEVTFHAAFEPKRAVRTARWKYIRHFDERHRPVLPNCDDSPSKNVWLDGGWREQVVFAEELYDLLFDPNEAHNLTGDGDLSSVLTEMRERLDRWMQSTADPLLKEALPVPAGLLINDADGLSPNEPVTTWDTMSTT